MSCCSSSASCPQARLDDLMISYASDGGGVGPHFDSYDVFLLQAQGRTALAHRPAERPDAARRRAAEDPRATSSPSRNTCSSPATCCTCRRATRTTASRRANARPTRSAFARRRAASWRASCCSAWPRTPPSSRAKALYRDPAQAATDAPGAIPPQLQHFAREALQAALKDPPALDRALGEYLTEPKANVWFEARLGARRRLRAVVLDRRTRMMYDARHVFINGES